MLVRDAIYQALFDLTAPLANSVGGPFQTLSRRYIGYQSCPSGLQPALYQRMGNTFVSQQDDFGVPTYRLKAWWFLYCQISPDPDSIPATILNPLIDAATNALLPPEGLKRTLPGCPNVVQAWQEGEGFVYEGELPNDVRAYAVIPITILAGY